MESLIRNHQASQFPHNHRYESYNPLLRTKVNKKQPFVCSKTELGYIFNSFRLNKVLICTFILIQTEMETVNFDITSF